MQVCLTKKINKIQEKFKSSLTQHTQKQQRPPARAFPSPQQRFALTKSRQGHAARVLGARRWFKEQRELWFVEEGQGKSRDLPEHHEASAAVLTSAKARRWVHSGSASSPRGRAAVVGSLAGERNDQA